MDIDSLLSQLNELTINNTLPEQFSKISVDDERSRLYKTYELAKKLYNTNDDETKILFKECIKNIYEHYLKEIKFDYNTYSDMFTNFSRQDIEIFMSKLNNIHTLLLQYTQFSYSWDINFSLIKIMEINRSIIEFINPISDIQLDLEKLSI